MSELGGEPKLVLVVVDVGEPKLVWPNAEPLPLPLVVAVEPKAEVVLAGEPNEVDPNAEVEGVAVEVAGEPKPGEPKLDVVPKEEVVVAGANEGEPNIDLLGVVAAAAVPKEGDVVVVLPKTEVGDFVGEPNDVAPKAVEPKANVEGVVPAPKAEEAVAI